MRQRGRHRRRSGGKDLVSKTWLIGIWEMCRTKSASESSSWPISELFFLQRATLPSIKSKNRPKGMKARAAQRLPKSLGLPMQ